MKKNGVDVWGKLLLIAIVIGIFAPAAQAEDARIEKLEAAVRALQGELNALKADRARQARKAAPAVDQKELERLISKTFDEKKGELGAVPSWVNNIKWGGDFRFRYEDLKRTSSGAVTNKRKRNRIRTRLKMKAKVNDEWDAIFRLAGGSSDSPTSTNRTLGDSGDDSFSTNELWLDLAYADWHPESMPGLNVYLGKMKNPFYKSGKNQLIWDGDVNPEGGAAKYSCDLDNNTKATVVGGAFWLRERSGDADASFFGIQAMLKHKYDGGSYLIYGASYYDLGNVDDTNDISGVGLNGNTAVAGGTLYKYDYDIVEGFAEYGWKCNGMPVAIFSNYVQNTAAPSGLDTAYSIGAQLNKAKKPGSWQLKASYREVESDAVFAGLSDSDFIDGGTGGKGWVLGYKYQISKNLQAGLTYFMNDRDRRTSDNASGGSGSQNFDRLQADLIFKF